MDYFDVSFSDNAFQITRISPPIPSEDISLIQKLINPFFGERTVSKVLADTMNIYFGYYLKSSLQDEDAYETFDYKWVSNSDKGTVIIPFSRKNLLADFDNSGLELGFDTQVANDK